MYRKVRQNIEEDNLSPFHMIPPIDPDPLCSISVISVGDLSQL
jgi:hypothetical protein